jgi:[acyl-carrier-protein] S-malonyltransferase
VRVAVVFPGQGTQQPAMGAPWKGHRSWSVIEAAEDALGESLSPLVLDATAEELGRTRNAQLAVLLTSLMVWDAVGAEIAANHEIVAFAGHSLGQVSALIASEALPLADGVRFAARRAEATQAAADAHPGKMAALLGATVEQAEAACAGEVEAWVANDNAPGQVVIAGTPAGLEAAIERAKAQGVRKAMPLSVGGAFHTPLMQPAVAALREALANVTFGRPSAPVISNDDAAALSDPGEWLVRLPLHPTRPVRWRASMETLAGLGAARFFETGHGSMIAGVAKRTVPDIEVIGLATPQDIGSIA